MTNQSFTTRVPQKEDDEKTILARGICGKPQSVSYLASGARTATTTGTDIDTSGYRGVILFLNVTAAAGVGGLKMRLRYKNEVTGAYLLAGENTTAFTTTGNPMCVFCDGAGGQLGNAFVPGWTNNGIYGLPMAKSIRLEIYHATADSYTYQVDYQLIP